MIRRSLAPSERAASTYSRSRIDSTWPRTMRAIEDQLKNAITTIVTVRLGPDSDTIAMPASRNGIDSTTSMISAITVSTRPPR